MSNQEKEQLLIEKAPAMLKLLKSISAMQGRSWRKLDKGTLGFKWGNEMKSIIDAFEDVEDDYYKKNSISNVSGVGIQTAKD